MYNLHMHIDNPWNIINTTYMRYYVNLCILCTPYICIHIYNPWNMYVYTTYMYVIHLTYTLYTLHIHVYNTSNVYR
jgi:hypothetical protein